MSNDTRKPLGGRLAEAVKSSPQENARQAEETLDVPRRREQEEAMRNKERTRSGDQAARDVPLDRPAD